MSYDTQMTSPSPDFVSARTNGRPEPSFAPAPMEPPANAHVQFRVPGRALALPADTIECIEARDNYVQVHAGEQAFLVRETITGVEQRLPTSFVRIHRSTIVNVEHVQACEPVRNGDARVTLRSGRHLRVSRTRRGDFDRQYRS